MNDEDSQILRDIHESTTQMRTYLFGVNGTDGFIKQTNLALQSHGRRLNSMERWRWALSGAWSVVTALFGWHALGGKQ